MNLNESMKCISDFSGNHLRVLNIFKLWPLTQEQNWLRNKMEISGSKFKKWERSYQNTHESMEANEKKPNIMAL